MYLLNNVKQPTARRDWHGVWASGCPNFTQPYLYERYVQWDAKSKDDDWKKKHRSTLYHKHIPVGQDICNCVYMPSGIHAFGHTGGIVYNLITQIISKQTPAYRKFIKDLKAMNE